MNIQTWLAQVQAEAYALDSRKRKRISSAAGGKVLERETIFHRILTPPLPLSPTVPSPTYDSMMLLSRIEGDITNLYPKRPQQDMTDNDIDLESTNSDVFAQSSANDDNIGITSMLPSEHCPVTPRVSATPTAAQSTPVLSAAMPTTASRIQSSIRTNASSPRKRFRQMELSSRPMLVRVINTDLPDQHMPLHLLQLCQDLQGFPQQYLAGIAAQSAFQNHGNAAIRSVGGYANFFHESRDALGPSPSPNQILAILRAASECQQNAHSEISWNFEVHAPLLSAVFRAADGLEHVRPCDWIACHTAKVIKEYLPKSMPEKFIDFGVFIEPSAFQSKEDDNNVIETDHAAIDAARRNLPDMVINHTSLHALRHRPLWLCVETKKAAADIEIGELQLGSWLAAHWSLLERLATEDAGLDDLAFLPAILIHGHAWFFVAMTRTKNSLYFWTKLCIGETSSICGILRIATALCRLHQWAICVYWPWFRNTALGLGK